MTTLARSRLYGRLAAATIFSTAGFVHGAPTRELLIGDCNRRSDAFLAVPRPACGKEGPGCLFASASGSQPTADLVPAPDESQRR
jgi:hypothetical protein